MSTTNTEPKSKRAPKPEYVPHVPTPEELAAEREQWYTALDVFNARCPKCNLPAALGTKVPLTKIPMWIGHCGHEWPQQSWLEREHA
jgi:hypothetical protein